MLDSDALISGSSPKPIGASERVDATHALAS